MSQEDQNNGKANSWDELEIKGRILQFSVLLVDSFLFRITDNEGVSIFDVNADVID